MNTLVELSNIHLTLNGQTCLTGVNLSLSAGDILTIVGPNGAGKSSLLKIVLGLHQPTSGTRTLAAGLRIGYMPQNLQVNETLPLSVTRFLSLSGNNNANAIQRALEDVGASHVVNRPIQRISGGEFQRVLLARALLRDPSLLVLDEPTQGVDLHGQQEFYSLLSNIRDQRQCAILMVSHDLHFVMAGTDKVLCLNQHVCCTGTADAVANHPEYLALFDKGTEKDFAVYTHRHDHHHDLQGDVIEKTPHKGCQHD